MKVSSDRRPYDAFHLPKGLVFCASISSSSSMSSRLSLALQLIYVHNPSHTAADSDTYAIHRPSPCPLILRRPHPRTPILALRFLTVFCGARTSATSFYWYILYIICTLDRWLLGLHPSVFTLFFFVTYTFLHTPSSFEPPVPKHSLLSAAVLFCLAPCLYFRFSFSWLYAYGLLPVRVHSVQPRGHPFHDSVRGCGSYLPLGETGAVWEETDYTCIASHEPGVNGGFPINIPYFVGCMYFRLV